MDRRRSSYGLTARFTSFTAFLSSSPCLVYTYWASFPFRTHLGLISYYAWKSLFPLLCSWKISGGKGEDSEEMLSLKYETTRGRRLDEWGTLEDAQPKLT